MNLRGVISLLLITASTLFAASNLHAQQPPFFTTPVPIHAAKVESLIVAPNGTLFAVTDFHLYRSTDRGYRWDTISIRGTIRTAISDVVSTPRGTIIARTLLGPMWRSTDNGATWVAVESDSGTLPPMVEDQGLLPSRAGRWCVGSAPGLLSDVYRDVRLHSRPGVR